jgi:photosystem II stability/assembly factor-like uncharacterized protein
MPDQDDRLSAELRDYYRQMAQQPAPDLTGRVMMATDLRAARRRRWRAIGGGVVAAAAVAAVIVVTLVNHNSPTGVAPAHSPTAAPTALPTSTPTSAPTSAPTFAPVVAGPAVHGFVPTDVTAVSAGQWWVLGYNGPSCSSVSCTRILHTANAGQTFTSIPVPPVAPAQNQQQRDRLRFADSQNGWVVNATGAVWATHDGGEHWTHDAGTRPVSDLEASGGTVYAIACSGPNCKLEKSATSQDSWSILPVSPASGPLRNLLVNGSHIWAVEGNASGGGTSLLASSDGGLHGSVRSVCGQDLGISGIYAVDTTVLWATCATGTQAAVFRSVDGGQHFTQVAMPGIANFASIAGVSSTTSVIGAQALLRTTDGGHSFATVESNQTQWRMVGFTTSLNGFAFDLQPALWRTNDAGAHWYRVQFP